MSLKIDVRQFIILNLLKINNAKKSQPKIRQNVIFL